MKKLHQINSYNSAVALDLFVSDVLSALKEKMQSVEDHKVKAHYGAAVGDLMQTINKQIAIARRYEEIAANGKTKHADQNRFEQAFAEAKRQVETGLRMLPDDESQNWL
jgi:hypothetical protein